MDVLNSLTFAGAAGWFLGFFCGAVTKCVSYRRAERRADADRIRARLDVSDFGAEPVRDAAAVAVARYRDRYRDSHGAPGSLGARLGAVRGDHDGIGSGAVPAGGPGGRADAAAVA